jgi:hypothetical protein
MVVASIAQSGCGTPTVSCEEVCQCRSGGTADKTCVAACAKAEADTAKQAADAHCTSEYQDFTRCESDNATCDPQKKLYDPPAGVCDSRALAFAKCAGVVASTGSGSSTTGM